MGQKNGIYLSLSRTKFLPFSERKRFHKSFRELRRGSSRRRHPKRFLLPVRVEVHRVQVDFGESGKDGEQLVLKIVVGRDYVKEILDDADIVVCPALVCRRIYPGTGHSGHVVWDDGIDLIPNAGVVAAGVSCQSYDIHP